VTTTTDDSQDRPLIRGGLGGRSEESQASLLASEAGGVGTPPAKRFWWLDDSQALNRQHAADVRDLSRERPDTVWDGDNHGGYLSGGNGGLFGLKRAERARHEHVPGFDEEDLDELMSERPDGAGADSLFDRPGLHGRMRHGEGWDEIGGGAREDLLADEGWSAEADIRLGEHTLTCVICQEEFVAKRSDALTCGPRCRKALSRLRKRVQERVTLIRECGESMNVAPSPGAEEAQVREVLDRVDRMEARLAETLLSIQRAVFAFYVSSGIPVEEAPDIFEILSEEEIGD
jgi:hypothetical protein